jgi:hypothetical protein
MYRYNGLLNLLLQLFKLLPEWMVDDMADFLLFGLQYLPAAVSTSMDSTLLTWLLTILSHPQACKLFLTYCSHSIP